MRSDFDGWRTGWSIVREAGSLVLQGAMAPAGFCTPAHAPVRARDLHTVVFVHGLVATHASLLPLRAWLARQGHRRQYAFRYRSTGSLEGLALQLKRRLDRDVKGGRIDLVCHSMGGLVARFYLQALGGDRRVSRLITLATPHRGTFSTAWVPSALVRQMTPGSPFLQHLHALPPPDVQVTSLVAGSDLIVLPAGHAQARFGTAHRVEGAGHTGILLTPTALRIVADAIGPCVERPPQPRQALISGA